MPPPILRCPIFEFKPRVSFRNELLLSASLYGIPVPAGWSSDGIPAPIYVSREEMRTLRDSQAVPGWGGQLGGTYGLTKAVFSLRFSDRARQWQQVAIHGSMTPWWQFQGGDVYFDVEIALYMLEEVRYVPGNAVSEQIFLIIMEHELLHVADESDLVRRWMPPRARQDPMVRRYLADADPVTDRMLHHYFLGSAFESWIRNTFWVPEHTRRNAMRDSPAEYQALQNRLETWLPRRP